MAFVETSDFAHCHFDSLFTSPLFVLSSSSSFFFFLSSFSPRLKWLSVLRAENSPARREGRSMALSVLCHSLAHSHSQTPPPPPTLHFAFGSRSETALSEPGRGAGVPLSSLEHWRGRVPLHTPHTARSSPLLFTTSTRSSSSNLPANLSGKRVVQWGPPCVPRPETRNKRSGLWVNHTGAGDPLLEHQHRKASPCTHRSPAPAQQL